MSAISGTAIQIIHRTILEVIFSNCRVIVLVTAPGVWTVLEQGTSLPNIQRKVVKVQEMVSGSLIVYRSVPETWLGSMEPVYD
jgi:hypothetical protein